MNVSLLLGCLSEGWVIEKSYRIACYGAIIAAAIGVLALLVELRRSRIIWWPLYGSLVLLHPGWRMWPSFRTGVLAVSSDCGFSDRFASAAIVIVLFALLVVVLFRPDFSRALFLLLLTGVCWLLYFATSFLWLRPFGAAATNAVLATIPASEPMQAFMMSCGRLFLYSITLTIVTAAVYGIRQRSRRRRQSNQALQPTAGRSDI